MATGDDDQEGMVPENLKTQLAIAVRSIRWSYAIFWSISLSDVVLEWREGYYNGDIKTRKTVQSVEFNADHMGLLRSEQLRELFESLSASETNPQTKRPTAALSPEDLTDTEWYYLVCMSFVFNIGQELPGSTFANGQPTWLCNAHCADSKIFDRSLLAKSASIQTVVCFPYLGGIIELGATEMVLEDSSLIEHVKAVISNKYHPSGNLGRNEDMMIDHVFKIVDSDVNHGMIDGSFMIDDFIDEEISNCMQNATSSSECISQTLIDNTPGWIVSPAKENAKSEDNHYEGVIESLLNISRRRFRKHKNQESSFVRWNKLQPVQIPRTGVNSQSLLKKIVMDVPRMSTKNNDNNSNHTLSERRRRERINYRFSVLESLIPSINKVDKVSILDNTIDYLKELEKRVAGLESCVVEAGTKRKHTETSEKTSENYYGSNKRKASDMNETALTDCSTDKVKVIVLDEKKDLVIEIRCMWRESLLVEILDMVGRLHLDSHSVHSSNIDGFLSMTINSKFKGSVASSVGMITEALQRVVWKR